MEKFRNKVVATDYVKKNYLKPSEISRHCYKTYIKRAAKMYDKSAYILDRTDKCQLDEERLQEITDIIKVNQELINNVWNTLKESVYYSRKNYYDSLEEK